MCSGPAELLLLLGDPERSQAWATCAQWKNSNTRQSSSSTTGKAFDADADNKDSPESRSQQCADLAGTLFSSALRRVGQVWACAAVAEYGIDSLFGHKDSKVKDGVAVQRRQKRGGGSRAAGDVLKTMGTRTLLPSSSSRRYPTGFVDIDSPFAQQGLTTNSWDRASFSGENPPHVWRGQTTVSSAYSTPSLRKFDSSCSCLHLSSRCCPRCEHLDDYCTEQSCCGSWNATNDSGILYDFSACSSSVYSGDDIVSSALSEASVDELYKRATETNVRDSCVHRLNSCEGESRHIWQQRRRAHSVDVKLDIDIDNVYPTVDLGSGGNMFGQTALHSTKDSNLETKEAFHVVCEPIAEEHLYEEIRNDSSTINYTGLSPPPLPPKIFPPTKLESTVCSRKMDKDLASRLKKLCHISGPH